jgi:hypothetical protein
MRPIVAIERDDIVIHELIEAIAVSNEVTRVPWRSSLTSVLGERLLRPTTGRLANNAGRVLMKSLAMVTAAGLALPRGTRGVTSSRIGGRRAVFATSPDQVDLALSMPGPRFYHAIDDFTTYAWKPGRVLAAERRLIDACNGVFAVSRSLADAISARHGIDRVTVVPSGVPADMIATTPPQPYRRAAPIAGVLGTISSRLRLDWLRQVVEATPWLAWRFVGGVEEAALAPGDRFHLRWLEQHPRCRFEGPRPYRDLVRYATLLDVAVMPYSARSANALGSPTRLFAHLAAGHPVLATPGCTQIGEVGGDLVTTCEDVAALVAALEALRDRGFDDGLHFTRWEAAHHHTWGERAKQVAGVIAEH